MSKLILLLLTFILGCVFMILPDWDGSFLNPDPFPFFDFSIGGICYQTYIFMIGEHLTMIILTYVIVKEALEYRAALWVFFGLVVVDLFDFLLSYNSVWYHFQGFPVSMNTLKVTIFGLAILNEWRKQFN